ncbi:helix-turn-helix domain-containing protein [Micromonospora sp. DT4]|uniref:helix-turn-helix domain-containing protein n=1 Tax=Micromonospora sp. DT4 TaxID=3393438 RepID=UPI003CF0B37F
MPLEALRARPATPLGDLGDQVAAPTRVPPVHHDLGAAATDLIAAHGVAGTSTEDIRKAAGVSGTHLYHYFDSKQALIRAVITRQADAAPIPGQPMMGLLDSFDALRAWARHRAGRSASASAHTTPPQPVPTSRDAVVAGRPPVPLCTPANIGHARRRW